AAQAPVGGRPCGWVTAAPHLILAYVGEDGTCVGAGVGGDGASGCDEGCGCLVSDRSARRRRSSSLSELVQRRVTDVPAARRLERSCWLVACMWSRGAAGRKSGSGSGQCAVSSPAPGAWSRPGPMPWRRACSRVSAGVTLSGDAV